MDNNIFNEDVINVAICLDEDNKTAIFLSSILKYSKGEDVNLSDPLLKFAFESQKRRIDAILNRKKELSQKRSLAGKKGLKSRWHNNNQDVESEV